MKRVSDVTKDVSIPQAEIWSEPGSPIKKRSLTFQCRVKGAPAIRVSDGQVKSTLGEYESNGVL